MPTDPKSSGPGASGIGSSPKPTNETKAEGARQAQQNNSADTPPVGTSEVDLNSINGNQTMPSGDQLIFPPEFAWFTNPDDNNLGVLQDPKLRIFIMGVEVSDWVADVRWTQNAKSEVINSSTTLTLRSMENLFMLTEANIFENDWGGPPGPDGINYPQQIDWRTSQAPKYHLWQYKNINNVFDLRTKTQRWSLSPNSCIFHNSDTIRIFARLPWTLEDCWQPVFNGYIEDPKVTRNATGEQIVFINGVTISDKLNRARVFTNFLADSIFAASISGDKQVRLPDASGTVIQSNTLDSTDLFNDVANPSAFRSFLYNASIKSLCEFIFYGDKVDDENEQITVQNLQKELTDEEKVLKASKDLQEKRLQLRTMKNKLKFVESAYGTDSMRAQILRGKISALETEIGYTPPPADQKQAAADQSAKATANQAASDKLKAAQKALQDYYDECAKAKTQPDSNQVQKLKADISAASVASQKANAEYSMTLPEGDIRKHGFGFLSPDLFIIEEYPYTGQVIPTDEVQQAETDKAAAQDTAAEQKQQTKQTQQAPAATPPPSGGGSKAKHWPTDTRKINEEYWVLNKIRAGSDGVIRPHTGIDVGATQGSTLYATINGTISAIKTDNRPAGLKTPGGGNQINLTGEDGYVHIFCHLSAIGVSNGQKVSSGQVIGKTGGLVGTIGGGHSTGQHLHWGVMQGSGKGLNTKNLNGGIYVNPNDWFNYNNPNSAKPTTTPPTTPQKTPPTPPPDSAANIDKEIDSEIALRDSYSSIDRTAEGLVMSFWHARCLYGFANGVPTINDIPESEIKPTQTSPGQESAPLPTIKQTVAGSGTSLNSAIVELIDPDIFSPKDFKKMCETRTNAWLDFDQVTYIGVNSDWLGPYSPHGKTVAVAYKRPKAGFGISKGLEGPVVQSSQYEATNISRAQILCDFLQRIDYRWWITGNGDIVIDFPRYDLVPEDYGDWANYLMVEGEIWNDDFIEQYSQLPSSYIVRGGLGSAALPEAGKEAIASMEVVYQLPMAMIRNGVQTKTLSYPYVSTAPQLQMLAGVQISKDLANTVQIPMGQLPPILTITPNCPIYLYQQDAYACVDEVSFSWQLGGDKLQYHLAINTSAFRVRMTPEQMFLEDLTDQNEKGYEQGLKDLKAAKLSNEEKKKKLDELKQNRGKVPDVKATAAGYNKFLNATDQYGNKLSSIPRYKHIQGKSSSIMDYRKAFSTNITDLGQYEVGKLSPGGIMAPILAASPSAAAVQENRKTSTTGKSDILQFRSTQIVLGNGRDLEELLGNYSETTYLEVPEEGFFTKGKDLDPNTQLGQGIKNVANQNAVDPDSYQAMMAYSNMASDLQPNYVPYDQAGNKSSSGEGMFGFPPEMASQTTTPSGLSLPPWSPTTP